MHPYVMSVPLPQGAHLVGVLLAEAGQIDVTSLILAVVTLVIGAGGAYGWQAKQRDKAAEVWKGVADAYKAEGEVKDKVIAELRAERQVMVGSFLKELSVEIGQVVGHVVAEELKKRG